MAKEIWEAVTERLADNVPLQACYELLDRLIAVGKLAVVPDAAVDEGRRHVVAQHLHGETAITLDDCPTAAERTGRRCFGLEVDGFDD